MLLLIINELQDYFNSIQLNKINRQLLYPILSIFVLMKHERKVFHLFNKRTNENIYFGSLKALFENTDPEIIGTPSYTYFTKVFLGKDVYENNNMKIIRSILITQPKSK